MGLSFEPMGHLLYTVKSCEDNPLKPPLCFASPAEWRGWLEDHHATHMICFTPRREGSNWSAVNIKRVAELKKKRLMRAAGLRTFEARNPSRQYSYEQRQTAKLGPTLGILIACSAEGRPIPLLTRKRPAP